MRVVLVAFLSLTTGCSALFMTPAHSPTHAPNYGCSEGYTAPTFDVLFSVLEVARTMYAVGAPDSAYQNSTISRPVDLMIGGGLMIAFVSSASYGFRAANECKAMLDEEEAPRARPRRRRVTPPPADLRLPPMPPPLAPTPAAYEPTSAPPVAPPADGGVPEAAAPAAPPPPPVPAVRQQADDE